jgi:hypothetical protein
VDVSIAGIPAPTLLELLNLTGAQALTVNNKTENSKVVKSKKYARISTLQILR